MVNRGWPGECRSLPVPGLHFEPEARRGGTLGSIADSARGRAHAALRGCLEVLMVRLLCLLLFTHTRTESTSIDRRANMCNYYQSCSFQAVTRCRSFPEIKACAER